LISFLLIKLGSVYYLLDSSKFMKKKFVNLEP